MVTPHDLPVLPDKVDALCFGGISLCVEPAADAYAALCIREADKRIIMLDPNIRRGFIKDEAIYRRRLARMIGQADIVKVSDEDLDKRGLKRPQFVIVDGAPGLEAALVALWGDDLPIQRCTVHKHRNLLAHAPKHMHEELGNDYRDMIYADTAAEVETRRKAFVRKWRLKCRTVADCLEEAGDRLFTFTRLDPSQWKAARTTNAIERLNEEFRRRIKTQAVLPCAETGPVTVWCRSFNHVMCSKGDEQWAQAKRMNFARMRCGSR
jgi:transposase-like protein